MQQFNSQQLRKAYIDFFKAQKHAQIPSSSLIPENDATVLFTTAGMHPLVPYLVGQKHPQGTRLVNVQKCVRTGDIDEVGDATHCTFFEMLGNWSLGDYFKKESITWSFQFLTTVLNIPIAKLAISVFAGDDDCGKDTASAGFWAELGIPADKIFYLPKCNNWWGPAGVTGPCGPDTEIFIDTGASKCSESCSPACNCGKYIEIWNNVFMEFFKLEDGTYRPLQNKNVDTGMGLERTICILNNLKSVYDTDLFRPAIEMLEKISGKIYGQNVADTKAMRIICDHIRTSTFIIGDEKGISPSNVDQGYVLRRLIRRAIRFCKSLNLDGGVISQIAEVYVGIYKDVYPEIFNNKKRILDELTKEENKFNVSITSGLKELEKVLGFSKNNILNGKTAFRLYDTFGFPIEMTKEIANEKGFEVDLEGYNNAEKEHQEKSKLGAEQKFKGGLVDNQEQTTNLHTCTHLMLSAIRRLLGNNIFQRGSNITAERLRFDFNFDRPLTEDELSKIETDVNGAISKAVNIVCEEMSLEDAKKSQALGIFESKYGQMVKVYTIEGYSKEICGGPHATNTSKLGKFKIVKEQSSSAGVRRIKAILES